ncbi:MAG: PrgI family protein [Candidatus Nealsonbacteria bacterium]|nr:PrgI family protein [Candidatus Nealsonbacteria bacterium]
MEFTVPQFIEYEAKVIGPFSFKQFIVVAIAGIVCFAAVLKTPFYIYVPVIIFVGGGSMALVFLKIGGLHPLSVLKNFFFFNLSPKVYIWQKKIMAPKIVIRQERIKEKKEEDTTPKIIKKSRLKELATQVETKN